MPVASSSSTLAAARPSGGSARQLGFEELGRSLFATTFVVLDLETTGLRPGTDRITEVGAVKVEGGEVLGELRTFVHPGIPIPPAITAVTGITDAMVRGAPGLDVVVPTLRRFLGDAVLVAHNARFDVAFLRAAWAEHDGRPFEPVVVDTAQLARRLVRDEVRDRRLATLARHFRARTLPDHRALTDARATVDVFHGLLERAGTLGAATLEDLRDLARSTSDRAFRRIGLVREAPPRPGTYRFVDARGEVLYVGKATDLRARLRTYFGQDPRRRVADLVRETAEVRWEPTPTVLEAEVREVRAIHALQPRFNRRSRRPDAAVHLALTAEAFPRLSVVRSPGRAHRRTVGPLPSRRLADELAAAIHDVLPLRTCTTRLRVAQDHPACVLKELGRCGAPCDGTQTRDDHDRLVAQVEALLTDPSPLLETLTRRMLRYATDGRFERAGEVRARRHTVARSLLAVRRRTSLAAVDELVARRRTAEGTELALVRRGRLVGTALVAPGDDVDAATSRVLAALTSGGPDLPPPTARDVEELDLVLAWLDRDGVELVRADGWAEPAAGGRALHRTVLEARRVAQQVRRDRQVLAGAKVARRVGVGA
jgi:DNA polymerase-3 subunit epsilon